MVTYVRFPDFQNKSILPKMMIYSTVIIPNVSIEKKKHVG